MADAVMQPKAPATSVLPLTPTAVLPFLAAR